MVVAVEFGLSGLSLCLPCYTPSVSVSLPPHIPHLSLFLSRGLFTQVQGPSLSGVLTIQSPAPCPKFYLPHSGVLIWDHPG